ncbi:hypothetical protein WAF17_12345 [Bernardetia sp. ABR2-2B]|uniref:hypothetical protein n=1 Tax=Bernardetia sp. ABR2-2B TaxID=3127472 RepID=UPI0030CECB33
MATNKKNTEERQLDELEKFLLTHRSKLQKEEKKSIDEQFDTSFSMEKNFLAIQAKMKNEQASRLEPKNIIGEKAKKLMQTESEELEKENTKNWVKPAPFSSETAKNVKIGQKKIERDVTNWVKPAPISSQYSSTSLEKRNQENTPATKTVSIRKFWTVAASLTALLVTTFLYQADTISMLTEENDELISMYEENGSRGFDENIEGEGQNYAQTVSLPAELIEAENYYTSIIAKDKKELKKKDTQNWVTPETIQTLDELDEAYKVMKSDLLEEQNPKVLVDEMLNNLKLRKQILDESIQILENSNSSNLETNKNI